MTAGPHGILLVDKAPERTSHDVVARVRWLLGTKKVGHAGTLDPMATGLLVLGVGQGTRLLTYLVGLGKTYETTLRLGRATSTDDREGEPLGEQVDASALPQQLIEQHLHALQGDIAQVPSTVSAIKIDGKRAYARARAGEDVQLAARPVRVSRFELTARREDGEHLDLDAVIDCSSGTYVRALARDLGAALEVGGHLTALRRTVVGPFSVSEAALVPARGEGDDVELPLHGLGEIASLVLSSLRVDAEQSAALGTGQRITTSARLTPPRWQQPGAQPGAAAAAGEEAPVAALDDSGRLIALLEREQERWKPILVVPDDARC